MTTSSESTDDKRLERPSTMRVQKYLARCGASSRRGAESLMSAGRVSVNGKIVTEMGSKVTLGKDVVALDGNVLTLETTSVFILLNKPAGYLSTMDDPFGRPTVAQLVPTQTYPGLFPVGRLDFDTTGVLLFTTDGETAHRLLHPRHHVAKTYIARVKGSPKDSDLLPLRQGITLDDGPCAPAEVALVAPRGNLVELKIHEGRKHQVKRMLEKVGFPVTQLERREFAGLSAQGVARGTWRLLTPEEVDGLKELIS